MRDREFFTAQHDAEHCLEVLHVSVLLNHANLIIVHESIDVRTLFDEPSTCSFTFSQAKFNDQKYRHVEHCV